jgi:methyl-accepting chemotaxis protein
MRHRLTDRLIPILKQTLRVEMKSIKLKILLGFCIPVTVLIVFLGLIISYKLNAGVTKQSDLLVEKVSGDIDSKLEGHLQMLEVFIEMMQDTVKLAAESVVSNPSTTKHIEDFNIKPLKGLVRAVAAKTNVDFIHLYDKNGKLIIAHPQVWSETSVEQYVKTWPAGNKMLQNIKEGLDGEKASIHGYSNHGNSFFQSFALDRFTAEAEGGISYSSLIVVRDFFDEPIGFCVAGKVLNQFTDPLERLNVMTDTAALIHHGSAPIAHVGFGQGKNVSDRGLAFTDKAKEAVYKKGVLTHQLVTLDGKKHKTVSWAIQSVNNEAIGMLTVAIPESQVVLAKQEVENDAISTKNDVQLWIVLLGGLSIVIFLIISSFFAAKIVNPIISVKDFSARVADGDLSEELHIQSSDELGSMTQSFNKMINVLEQTVIGIRGISTTLSEHAEGLLTETEELANGSKEQDVTTQQVTASVAEMAQNITDVSQNASDAAQASKEVSETARKGKEKVMETVSGMKNISGTVDEMASIVGELRENSAEIVNIVSLIDDIAEQTNLLALNAAIEAARAGEQGRGFSIVADEVRKLAERTSTATKDIHSMVKNIQSDTERSVKSMDSGRVEVEKGMQLVEEASAAMDSIVQFSSKCLDMVHQIASACEEQSSASDEISSSMEGIARLTNATMGSSGRIETSSRDLSAVSAQLIRAASWFKVSQSEVANATGAASTSEPQNEAGKAGTA